MKDVVLVAKIKHKKRHVPRLQKGAGGNEIVRWTKKHDVFDRLKAGISEVIDDHSDLIVFRREILKSLKKVAGKGGVEGLK